MNASLEILGDFVHQVAVQVKPYCAIWMGLAGRKQCVEKLLSGDILPHLLGKLRDVKRAETAVYYGLMVQQPDVVFYPKDVRLK
jgi:hypothetical protein